MKTYFSHKISIEKVLQDVRERTVNRGLVDAAFMRLQEKLDKNNGSKRSQKQRRVTEWHG